MQRQILGFALAIATTALVVSCGSDDEKSTTNNNTQVTPDSGPEPGVPCGNTRCTPRDGTTETPCCMDRFTSACGVQGPTGACTAPPPMEDPRCPSVQVPVVGKLTSCCTTANMCGIVGPAGFGGGGCTELGEAKRRAMEFTGDGGFDAGGFMITFPDPKPCM